MRPQPPTRVSASPVGAIVRALASLLALAAVLAGIPYALVRLGRLPEAAPSWQGAREVLTSPDDGTVLITTLTLAGWVLWLVLVYALAVETAALVRRRAARRRRGLAGMQQIAAWLLGGLVTLTTPAVAAAATATPAAAASLSQDTHGEAATTPQRADASAQERSSAPQMRVTAGNLTLWDVAAQKLGDGRRWREIAALNPGIEDLQDATGVLRENTVLAMPADYTPTGDTQQPAGITQEHAGQEHGGEPQTARGTVEYTVESGDTLSHIADEHLGDPTEYPEIYDDNRGVIGPDPDVIITGQELTIHNSRLAPPEQGPGVEDDRPGRQDDHQEAPAAPETASPDRPGESAPDDAQETGTPDRERSPAGASDAPDAADAGRDDHNAAGHERADSTPPPEAPAATPPSEAPAPEAAGEQSTEATDASSSVSVRMFAGIGALLAAAVAAAFGFKRLLAQRARRPGHIPAVEEASPLEEALTDVADQDTAELLDVALRTLAHHAEEETPPALAAVKVTDTIHVLPDAPAEPAPPFTAGAGGWWTLPERPELLPAEQARELPAPYPLLATLGVTEDHQEVYLADLAQLGVLLLDGSPEEVAEVCLSLTLEVALSPWGDHAEVLAVGLGADMPRLVPTGRLRHVDHVGHAVRDLAEKLLEEHQTGQEMPWLVICANQVSEEDAWQLADAYHQARGGRVGLVLPASARAMFPTAAVLDVTPQTAQPLPGQPEEDSARITVQRITADVRDQLTARLRATEQPAREAEGPWQHVPEREAAEPEPAPRFAPAIPSPAAPTEAEQPDVVASDVDTFNTATSGSEDQQEDTVFPALLEAANAGPRPPSPATNAPSPAVASTADEPVVPGPAPAPPAPKGGGPVEESAADIDEAAPTIRVLGPVEVTGIGSTGHGPALAALACLLHFKPARDPATLTQALSPTAPWTTATLNKRISELRNKLGAAPDGELYVPRRRAADPYHLSPAIRSDWQTFQNLAHRGLAADDTADLEAALGLVRGRPFAGRDFPWALPLQQQMISRIVDVAHTVAVRRAAAGTPTDLEAARSAIATGLEVEPTIERLYRDWMRIEHAAEHRAGVYTAIGALQDALRVYDLDMQPETDQLITKLLGPQSLTIR